MSGQWEVVGKKKDKGSKAPVKSVGKDPAKKTNSTLNVKIEDVLAKSQVKNLYAGGNKNKENKPVVDKKVPDNEPKKAQSKNKKPQGIAKVKPSKSIESALNSLNIDDFRTSYENYKLSFPGNGRIVLEMLGRFLNSKILVTTDDPVFSNKPPTYPSNFVPKEIKQTVDEIYKESGTVEMQNFFNSTIYQMADLMNKNTSALGFKLLLQHIALKEPRIVTALLHRLIDLRSSYENRPNIGLSILFVAGQAGINNFQAGLEVYQHLMLPIIELKHYSRFVVKYFIDLIKSAKNVPLKKEEFNVILETAFTDKKNFPADLKRELVELLPKLKPLLFLNSKEPKKEDFFRYFLQKLATSGARQYQDFICSVLVKSLQVDESNFSAWTKVYHKNVASSALLLSYIDNNWKSVSSQLASRAFSTTLRSFSEANEHLLQEKKKERGLQEAEDTIKNICYITPRANISKGIYPITSNLVYFLLSYLYCNPKEKK